MTNTKKEHPFAASEQQHDPRPHTAEGQDHKPLLTYQQKRQLLTMRWATPQPIIDQRTSGYQPRVSSTSTDAHPIQAVSMQDEAQSRVYGESGNPYHAESDTPAEEV